MSRAIVLALVLGAAAWADPVTNGGFETGDLTGWTDAGDSSSLVVATLDGGEFLDPLIFPTECNYFAVVGNGPGDIGLDDAPDVGVLMQSFSVLGVPATLSFDWNFVTSEFTGDDAEFLDYFEITLSREGGPTYVLVTGDVGGGVSLLTKAGIQNGVLDFSFIDPVDGDLYGVAAPDGSVYLSQTGWFNYTFYALPGNYTLSFLVGDDFDGFVDSALLVDNVAVPEPTGLALLSVLAVAGIAARRRRQR
jgi:hypothetical protein